MSLWIFWSFIALVFQFTTLFLFQMAVAISSYFWRYQSLSHSSLHQNFGTYFLVFRRCDVTPHRLCRDSLILRICYIQQDNFIQNLLKHKKTDENFTASLKLPFQWLWSIWWAVHTNYIAELILARIHSIKRRSVFKTYSNIYEKDFGEDS